MGCDSQRRMTRTRTIMMTEYQTQRDCHAKCRLRPPQKEAGMWPKNATGRPDCERHSCKKTEIRKKNFHKNFQKKICLLKLVRCEHSELRPKMLRQPNSAACLSCICCLIQTGHPQPSCCSGPSVRWVSLPGPTGQKPFSAALLHCCCTAQPALTRATKNTPSVKHTCRGFWPTWIAPTTVSVTFTRFTPSWCTRRRLQ